MRKIIKCKIELENKSCTKLNEKTNRAGIYIIHSADHMTILAVHNGPPLKSTNQSFNQSIN